MLFSRRAVTPGASPSAVASVRGAIAVLGFALASTLSLYGLLAVRVARKVVTPGPRVIDTEILDLDTAAQTITLARTPDTTLPGRYGLFTAGTADYLKLGSVLAEDERSVKRKLLTHVPTTSSLSAAATFSGWYYTGAEELQLPFTPELVGSALGPCPAWLFPAGTEAATWVIQVHGRGTTRAEGLRAVPVFHSAGVSSLLVSYRNDGEAPRSRPATYTLGATEWRDVDAALSFARRRGARRVILMGWSMGGAIVLQTALNSAHRDLIAGIVLESPVIDWRIVLEYQATLAHVPSPLAGLAIGALGSEWAAPLTRTGRAIPFERLDVVARAAELRHPILILHSEDDGFVPSGASHALLAARPDLVELQVFDVARHTKLWNYDSERWSGCIRSWLERHDLVG